MAKKIADNFAGGGGASTGIERAIGRCVDVAINHDRLAIMTHSENHPKTKHLIEDVYAVDPIKAVDYQDVGLAWFSPDCTHHSKAKGGKPRSKKIRGLAWIVLRWAARVRPDVIILENVEEFAKWGPLKKGQPKKSKESFTFIRWWCQLYNLGYKIEKKELRACDFGAPTTRKRLFIIARCDGKPIVWPKPTHGDPDGDEVKAGKLKPWRTAAECIDWSIPTKSIFNRKKPPAEATLRRLAKGIRKFVIESKKPFIVPGNLHIEQDNRELVTAFLDKYHGPKSKTDGPRGSDLYSPVKTVDTSNRFSLVTVHLQRDFGQSIGSSVSEPMPTTVGTNKTALVSLFLTKFYGTSTGSDILEPMPTITGQGQHIAHVEAFLTKYYATGEGQDLNDPMHTITTKARLGLVTIHGDDYQIIDIRYRMLTPRELARAQGFPDTYKLYGSLAHQIRMIGNSVCPPVAEALVRENVDITEYRMAA